MEEDEGVQERGAALQTWLRLSSFTVVVRPRCAAWPAGLLAIKVRCQQVTGSLAAENREIVLYTRAIVSVDANVRRNLRLNLNKKLFGCIGSGGVTPQERRHAMQLYGPGPANLRSAQVLRSAYVSRGSSGAGAGEGEAPPVDRSRPL